MTQKKRTVGPQRQPLRVLSASKDAEHVIVETGSIFAYRLYDLGAQIHLEKATSALEARGRMPNPVGRRRQRALLIAEHPLVLPLPGWQETISGQTYDVVVTGKIWSFGTLSLQLALKIKEPCSIENLNLIGNFLENDQDFHAKTLHLARELMEVLSPSIEAPALWEEYEDYLVFVIDAASGLDADLPHNLLSSAVVSLIMTEPPMKFCQSIVDSLRSNIYQYSNDDVLLIHWNGALIYDRKDGRDVVDIIEYALCQLLELRYYDSRLDGQLKTLYEEVEHRQEHLLSNPFRSLFSNPFTELSRQAALQYIDISEIVGRVGNAFKVTGDFYYAKVFRAVTEKFHINDWRQSIDHKLGNLAEVSKIFQGEINERRAQVMEFTIMLLITIEVLHLFGVVG